MTVPRSRPAAREAGPELLVLAHWEAFVAWLLDCCGRWPRSVRFSLTQRLENHALDVLELMVVARYEPRLRNVSVRTVPSDDPLMLTFEISGRLVGDRRRGVVRLRSEMTHGGRVTVA